MKKLVTFMAGLAFFFSGLVFTATAHAACQEDIRQYSDTVPYNQGYTRIDVVLRSDDCGSVRYLKRINVWYNEDRVSYLDDVLLRTDGRNDGSWDVRKAWEYMLEYDNYYLNKGCTDPCDFRLSGIVRLKNSPVDTIFGVHGVVE